MSGLECIAEKQTWTKETDTLATKSSHCKHPQTLVQQKIKSKRRTNLKMKTREYKQKCLYKLPTVAMGHWGWENQESYR